jgi:hypothetical protein
MAGWIEGDGLGIGSGGVGPGVGMGLALGQLTAITVMDACAVTAVPPPMGIACALLAICIFFQHVETGLHIFSQK